MSEGGRFKIDSTPNLMEYFQIIINIWWSLRYALKPFKFLGVTFNFNCFLFGAIIDYNADRQ